MAVHPSSLPPRSAALVLALCAALLALRLGAVPLLGPDEPRYTRVAVEMHRSGDYVTPTLQGQPWLEKPVLFYWLAAGAFRFLGETEAAARAPAAAATLLLVFATGLFAARTGGGGAGLHSMLVAGTCVLAFAYGRAASMDMLVAAPITAAIALLGLRLLGIAGRLAVPVAWAFMGLATLAKGPLGFVAPLLVVAGAAVAERTLRPFRVLLSLPGIALFLLVAGPWYALVLHAQGFRFVETFLLDHNLQRFTSTIHRHPGPPVYYLPVLLAGLFPWSGLLVPALRDLRPRLDSVDRFLCAWLLAPLVFFSLAGSKLPGYILPCLPPLAILMGRAADRLVTGASRPGLAARAGGLVTLGLAAAVAAAPAALVRNSPGAFALLWPVSVWALLLAFGFSRRVARDPEGALRLLRVGAAGLLVLFTSALPPILDALESGRRLFAPARGREVLAWGAWRTAWMSGFFYNDGRVREVAGFPEIARALEGGAVLVIAGPGERGRLLSMTGVVVQPLAHGPRDNTLLKVERRDAALLSLTPR